MGGCRDEGGRKACGGRIVGREKVRKEERLGKGIEDNSTFGQYSFEIGFRKREFDIFEYTVIPRNTEPKYEFLSFGWKNRKN